jgi:hypothetical protein
MSRRAREGEDTALNTASEESIRYTVSTAQQSTEMRCAPGLFQISSQISPQISTLK